MNGGGTTKTNDINQKGGVKIENIKQIFKIAVCAFLWGIISNNYYEKLDTFGPQITELIKFNYQDVLTPWMGELDNLNASN